MHSGAMTAAPDPQLRLQPEWLAHRYDPQHDAVHFVRADRALRREIPFLTDEYLPSASDPIVVGREEALAAAPPAAPIHFIFHSAYCCSTLLANAYDREGASGSLKEPIILNDLVGWQHRGGEPKRIAEILDGALRLLARPFAEGEAMVVKPSNVVNGLIPVMLAMRPEARALLLHAPLRGYLGSIANKGLWGRNWVRDLFLKQLKSGIVDLGFQPEDHLLQTDLQVAALGWLAQHRLFARLAGQYPDRVRTLDSETLLARPADALAALDALLGLADDPAARERIVGDAFSRHAKFGGAFDRDSRAADQRMAAEVHGDEIDKVATWAETVATNLGVGLALPAPLLKA
jgi:hypothetical protein